MKSYESLLRVGVKIRLQGVRPYLQTILKNPQKKPLRGDKLIHQSCMVQDKHKKSTVALYFSKE